MITHEGWQWRKSLERVVKALRTTHEAESPLQCIVEEIAEVFGCQTCAIILRDEKSGQFRIRHHHGLSHTFAKTFFRPFEIGSFQKLMWTGQPLVVQDATLNPAFESETRLEKPYGAGVIVRIHANHSRLGYLHVDFRRPMEFSTEEMEILQMFADLAGVAILKTRLHEENLKLNPFDPDSGLLHYTHFVTRLERYLVHAKALGESFTVVIFDIDHYRDLVNVYGGQRAHAVFQKICTEVSKAISPFDAASRYGLDEIIVFLSNTSSDQARAIAERVRRQIGEWHFPEIEMKVTVSGGIASFPQHGVDLHTLIGSASKALFETQRVRRNAVYSLNASPEIGFPEEIDQEKLKLSSQ